MRPPIRFDLTGERFGYLTAVKYAGFINGRSGWVCKCDCGNEITAPAHDLLAGKYTSCGCKKKDRIGNLNKTHGLSKTILYKKWQGMLRRCRDTKYNEFDRYGGRGITVCDEWKTFEPFRDWAVENGFSEGLSLERKDIDGNYCPENCEWIPLSKQSWNTSQTIWVELDGEKMPLMRACEIYKMPRRMVYWRIRNGWNIKDALTTPKKKNQFV